jgi:hypothetical protein
MLDYTQSAMRLGRRLAADERGNFVITFAILSPVVFGAVIVAMGYTAANHSRTQLQSALDSAVLAGVLSGGDKVAAAQTSFTGNVASQSYMLTSGISASFSVATLANGQATVSGIGSADVTNPLGGLFGLPAKIAIGGKASATNTTVPLCILALNNLATGSIDQNGNSQINAPTCAVQANTTSSAGITQQGNVYTTAKMIKVGGGYTGTGYSTKPQTNAPPINDPYSSLSFPPYDSCSSFDTLTIKSDATLSPGTYCGGIAIDSQSNVTLLPGIYVMNGGSFTVKGGSSVTGNQVMIAFTSDCSAKWPATFQEWGNSTVTLTSPASGPYTNIQFEQDPAQCVDTKNMAWFSVGGSNGNGNADDSSKLTFDGTVHLPRQELWIFGGAVTSANSPGVAIVVDQMWPQGNAKINVTNNNTRNLNVPAPAMAAGGRLVN